MQKADDAQYALNASEDIDAVITGEYIDSVYNYEFGVPADGNYNVILKMQSTHQIVVFPSYSLAEKVYE